MDDRRCLIGDTGILFDLDRKRVVVNTMTDTRPLTEHRTVVTLPEEGNIGEDGMQIVEESHGDEVYNQTTLDFHSENL